MQAQQEMELKLAQVLERLAHIQSSPIQNDESKQRIMELEMQVADLTNRRLDSLEQMQQQQMQWQVTEISVSHDSWHEPHCSAFIPFIHKAQLLQMSREPPGRQKSSVIQSDHSRGPYGRAVSTQSVSSGQSAKAIDSALDEEKRAIFDTPAPRAKPPKPTKASPTNRLKNQVRQRTPEKKKKNGKWADLSQF